MTHWVCVKKDEYAIRVQETLVSAFIHNYVDVYPSGTFECAHCGKHQIVNEDKPSYWVRTISGIICTDCKMAHFAEQHQVAPIFVHADSTDDILLDDHVVVINKRSTEEERATMLEQGKARAQLVANANGLTYLENQKTEDIYHQLLAKRVLRAMKSNVETRTRNKLFRVLYRCADLDLNAALVLATRSKL